MGEVTSQDDDLKESSDIQISPTALESRASMPSESTNSSFTTLKERIRQHYELASDYYHSLWPERAQVRLVELLLDHAQLENGSRVLDVGCGLGGTSRHLAKHRDCQVTGITISGKQVEMAFQLTLDEANGSDAKVISREPVKVGRGSTRFVELDAEKIDEYFRGRDAFDCVWISEAMSHLPDKELFFRNAFNLLCPGGKLVVADWFKNEGLTYAQLEADIKPIESKHGHPSLVLWCLDPADRVSEGMLLPPLCTQSEYVKHAEDIGFQTVSGPLDISQNVSKTW
ncbi:MAG: hypothetical protein Q9219_005548 [cf. Caloplaca sp. 3 TL-2023]